MFDWFSRCLCRLLGWYCFAVNFCGVVSLVGYCGLGLLCLISRKSACWWVIGLLVFGLEVAGLGLLVIIYYVVVMVCC